MAKLIFDATAVRTIYDHAKGCDLHVPTWGMLGKREYLKAGVKLKRGAVASASDVDQTKIPAHLKLVKDEGCYLMSSGLPALVGSTTKNAVVYAEGLGPGCDWEVFQDLSGDDFVEALPLAAFHDAFQANARLIVINLTKTRVVVTWSN